MKRIACDNPDVLWAKLNGTDEALVPIFEAMGIKKVCAWPLVMILYTSCLKCLFMKVTARIMGMLLQLEHREPRGTHNGV